MLCVSSDVVCNNDSQPPVREPATIRVIFFRSTIRKLKSVLDMVVKIVNYIKMRPLKRRLFTKLCAGMEAEHSSLIQHTEIRWLSRGKVLSRFYELRQELLTNCFFQENLKKFVECLSDDHWCSKLAYLTNIFHELNLLNSIIQGRNENILSSTDKINAF